MSLLDSSTEENFDIKNPLPIGIVMHGEVTCHNFFKDDATYSEEKDFPQGLEIIEHAQGLHKDW